MSKQRFAYMPTKSSVNYMKNWWKNIEHKKEQPQCEQQSKFCIKKRNVPLLYWNWKIDEPKYSDNTNDQINSCELLN